MESSGFYNFFSTTIRIAFLLFVAWLIIKIVEKFVVATVVHLLPSKNVKILITILRYSIYALLALMIMQQLSFDISAILTTAGVVGIAVGFAAQALIANVVSGLLLLLQGTFTLGDILLIHEISGKVHAIGLCGLTLRTSSGESVYVAYQDLLRGPFTFYPQKLVIETIDIFLPYMTDIASECIFVQDHCLLSIRQTMISQVKFVGIAVDPRDSQVRIQIRVIMQGHVDMMGNAIQSVSNSIHKEFKKRNMIVGITTSRV
jgi:hypothetical protein